MDARYEQQREFPIDLIALAARSLAYSLRCECWLQQHDVRQVALERESITTVGRLSAVVTTEVLRAFEGWLCDDNRDRELSIEPESAAARALTAIERSRQAWLTLVHLQQIRGIDAAPFVTDLVWLKYEIARAFPHA